MSNPVLDAIRRSLARQPGASLADRPAILAARLPGSIEAEVDLLLQEIQALSGQARRMPARGLEQALVDLVREQAIRKACLWSTPLLLELGVEQKLRNLGVEVIPALAEKHDLAQCDLGVTEADYALPETGTLGLLSSPQKPRAVSLLPRVHLALVPRQALRADLHQVFAEAENQRYLVLISGPSRTADIELTLALGVHGPKTLVAWVLDAPI